MSRVGLMPVEINEALMDLPQILGDIPERWHYDDACTVGVRQAL